MSAESTVATTDPAIPPERHFPSVPRDEQAFGLNEARALYAAMAGRANADPPVTDAGWEGTIRQLCVAFIRTSIRLYRAEKKLRRVRARRDVAVNAVRDVLRFAAPNPGWEQLAQRRESEINVLRQRVSQAESRALSAENSLLLMGKLIAKAVSEAGPEAPTLPKP